MTLTVRLVCWHTVAMCVIGQRKRVNLVYRAVRIRLEFVTKLQNQMVYLSPSSQSRGNNNNSYVPSTSHFHSCIVCDFALHFVVDYSFQLTVFFRKHRTTATTNRQYISTNCDFLQTVQPYSSTICEHNGVAKCSDKNSNADQIQRRFR